MKTLVSFVFATAILAISPGPDNIFVLTQSITYGKKQGLATVAGLLTGCLVHTTLVAFGVSAILTQHKNLFFILKLFGSGYLLYLAYKAYTSNAQITFSADTQKKKSAITLYKTGFWMNVLNPKVTIFFLAFFPQFLFSKTLSPIIQFYILGAIFIIVSFLIFATIAVLSATIARYIKQHTTVNIYLKWMQIVVFILIAVFIIL